MSGLSARNPAVQHLRRLSGRRGARLAAGQYVVEGPTLLAEALHAGVDVEVVYVDEAASHEVRALAAKAGASGARCHEVRTGVLDHVTDAVTSQGVAALVHRPGRGLEEIAARGAPFLVVLDGIADPGNAGTLLRSAEAAGAAAVVVGPGGVDPFAPKTVRASAGAVFHVPIVEVGELPAALAALAEAGWRLLGTAAADGTPLEDADLSGPVAFVLGSEAHGLAPPVAARLDGLLTIPMVGRAESLNVAMAGTLVVFEAARRRRSAA
ncbi:MAG: RNA methyltransferase [Acidimicrobiales bacterium]|nr:RNA methyltransferase [Acidimicrobiales bacterium]